MSGKAAASSSLSFLRMGGFSSTWKVRFERVVAVGYQQYHLRMGWQEDTSPVVSWPA